MQPVYCLYRSSGRIPTVLRRYPYGHCTKRNPHRRTFRQNTEEYGQTLPAVLEPNGMNFWTPQTQDTEANVRLPIITKIRKYKVSAIHIGLSEVVHRITVPWPWCLYRVHWNIFPKTEEACSLTKKKQQRPPITLSFSRLFHLCRNDRTFPFSHFPIHL